MSLRLEIKKKMLERCPRVKSIDFHEKCTWVLLGLYSGTLSIHDYTTNSCVQTIDASNYPVRTAKFICSLNYVVCGSDDFQIRVFNYNTLAKVRTIDAHADFIRSIIVHPSEPLIISCSDDAKIKIWNYEKDFILVRTLDEHKHFVLALAFNSKDLTKFASASMDKTVKVWNISTEGKANFSLTGHKSSVNALDFYKGDKPHLVTGSDDKTIKIWDYQTRQCLLTLEAHTLSVTSVVFHPDLPLLISSSEDGKTILHHSGSHTILNTLQYNLGMGWAAGVSFQDSNVLAFGYDQGAVVIKIGSDDLVVSINNGKLLWSKSMQIYTANLKAVEHEKFSSGQKVRISPKEIGSTDIYPTYLKHSPNGHHFALCNRKEFTVIKTASFKTVISGNGTNLIWQNDSDFAVIDNDVVSIFRNLEPAESFKMAFLPVRIFQGSLIGIAGPDCILFYEWSNLNHPIHNLAGCVEKVWWDDEFSQVIVASESRMTLYSHNKLNHDLVETLCVHEKVTSGVFVDKIFYYITKSGKINLMFKKASFFQVNAEKKQFILGALEAQQRIYLFDKSNSVYSHAIPFEVYQQASLYVESKGPLPEVPTIYRDRVAKFLEAFGFKMEAYKLVQNQDHRFELAIQLGYIRQAHEIACETNSSQKIRIIGDISLKKGNVELAIDCYKKIDDLNTLLMIYSSLQLPKQLGQLAVKAEELTKMNVAYMCYFLTNSPQKCVEVLLRSKRFAEAALFARTYCSDRVSECVKEWKDSLTDPIMAQKISDPNEEYEEEDEEGNQQEIHE